MEGCSTLAGCTRCSSSGLVSQAASPSILLPQHGTCSPLAPQLLVKGGKEGNQSSIPTYLGKAMLACSAPQPTELALYTSLPSGPWAPLTQILLTGLPCKGEGGILPLLRNVQNPLTPQLRNPRVGWVLGRMRWKSSVTSSLRRKPNRLCLSQRCPKVFSSALPSTEELHQVGKNSSSSSWAWTQQVWGSQGGVRWCEESYHFFRQSLWATLKASLNVQFSETRGWADTG